MTRTRLFSLSASHGLRAVAGLVSVTATVTLVAALGHLADGHHADAMLAHAARNTQQVATAASQASAPSAVITSASGFRPV